MTTLTRCYEISLIILMMYSNRMEYSSCSYRSNFITTRRYKTNEWLDEVPVGTEATLLYKTYETLYQLRFQPGSPRPRLFWHKFPQNQQEEIPTTMEIMTSSRSTVTEDPIEPVFTEQSPLAPQPTAETEPTTEGSDLMTTAIPSATSSSTTPMASKPLTTFSTIMNPSNYFPFNLAEKLKNLFAYNLPSHVNLIQKQSGVETKGKTKSKGFLSLFEVIKFANTKCSVNMGDISSMEGICYHDFECKSLGGISTERCGEGLGVCCIFLSGCGDTIGQPVSYFESPNYPRPVREIMICVLIINLRANVQQLRLDFLMFELNRPTDGNCEDDQFIVSGHNINFVVPVLCGINTGHHIYVHVGDSPDRKIYISFFAKAPAGPRAFNIKISQLEDNLAPDGCLQFYSDVKGTLKSFNYDIDGTLVDNNVATYFNNLNYAICIKRAKDYCSVNYVMEQIGGSNVAGVGGVSADQLDFQIINKDEDGNDLVPDGQAGAGIFNCPDDFLAINQVRLCGERFNDGTDNEDFNMHAPVRDVASGPIILPFHSDEQYVGRGFRLAYKQELCL